MPIDCLSKSSVVAPDFNNLPYSCGYKLKAKLAAFKLEKCLYQEDKI